MGRTLVKGSGRDASGHEHHVTGHSGNGKAVWQNIEDAVRSKRADAAILRVMLIHQDFKTPIRGEKRTGASCAEPHAVSQLLAKGVALQDIQLEFPRDERGKKAECHFCARWVLPNAKIDVTAIHEYIWSPADLPSWCW